MRKLYWDEVAETLDLQRVLDELGIQIKDTNRSWLLASCPLSTHPGADANPSFGIHEDDMIFNCFVCGGGSLPKLIIDLEGLVNGEDEELDSAWQQSLRWLSQFSEIDTGLDVDPEHLERIKKIQAERSVKVKRVRKEPLPIFSLSVLDKMEPVSLEMLDKWNITSEETVDTFRLRYDPQHERHDYVGPALIVPHIWQGELVGYQERWMEEDRPKKVAKYTNSHNFPKKETLFNWDIALIAAKQGHRIIVVESAMTVIRLHDMGEYGLATFGASVSKTQISLLGSLPDLVLSYDDDVAGRGAIKKLREALSSYAAVNVLKTPKGSKDDLADLSEEAVRSLLAAV